jgi:hypothetical protein
MEEEGGESVAWRVVVALEKGWGEQRRLAAPLGGWKGGTSRLGGR